MGVKVALVGKLPILLFFFVSFLESVDSQVGGVNNMTLLFLTGNYLLLLVAMTSFCTL